MIQRRKPLKRSGLKRTMPPRGSRKPVEARKGRKASMGASKRIKIRTDKLDVLFSEIVRSAGRCRRCGRTDSLQCAHVVSRRYHGVRWDFDNAFSLCARCHMYFTYRPLEWDGYVVSQIGEDRYRAIKKRAMAFVGPVDRGAVMARLKKAKEEAA